MLAVPSGLAREKTEKRSWSERGARRLQTGIDTTRTSFRPCRHDARTQEPVTI
jgi:hypothetical protein